MSRAGRKRKSLKKREGSGRVQRASTTERVDEITKAVREARERVFSVTKAQAGKMRESSVLGRLEVTGEITTRQYKAGRDYVGIVQVRNRMVGAGDFPSNTGMDAAHGYSGEPDEDYEDRFIRALKRFRLVQNALSNAGKEDRQAAATVYAVCFGNWELPDLVGSLRIGLNHIANALGLPPEGVDGESDLLQTEMQDAV